MALYPCPECGSEVPTDARACPNCGKPMEFEQVKPQPTANNKVLIGCFWIVILLVWAVVACPRSKSSQELTSASQGASAPPILTGSRMSIAGAHWWGFRDKGTLDRAMDLASQSDQAASKNYMMQLVATGLCIPFKDGEEVSVDDSSTFSGTVKIRRKGETSGWWTYAKALR